MALEAVLFPQDPFGYGCEDLIYSMGGGLNNNNYWGYEVGLPEPDKALLGVLETDMASISCASHGKEWDVGSSSPEVELTRGGGRRKRRRVRSGKNKEELESQRMNHIAVERNRRRQMNEYLAVLRSLMPSSYVQRGDQASIVGGAINFMKELEQVVQSMEAQKSTNTSPFSQFFSFPQYSKLATTSPSSSSSASASSGGAPAVSDGAPAKRWRSAADIEVTMVETHAHLKILVKKQPRQLLKIVAGFQTSFSFSCDLNVTTTRERMVLYSVSVKVDEGSQVNTVDEIAAAVNELLWRIQEEASLIT